MEKKNNIGTVLELRDFTLRGFTLNMESRRLPHSLASVIVHLSLTLRKSVAQIRPFGRVIGKTCFA